MRSILISFALLLLAGCTAYKPTYNLKPQPIRVVSYCYPKSIEQLPVSEYNKNDYVAISQFNPVLAVQEELSLLRGHEKILENIQNDIIYGRFICRKQIVSTTTPTEAVTNTKANSTQVGESGK